MQLRLFNESEAKLVQTRRNELRTPRRHIAVGVCSCFDTVLAVLCGAQAYVLGVPSLVSARPQSAACSVTILRAWAGATW